MRSIIHPSILSGILQIPASKSYMQRACAAAFIKKGKTIIYNAAYSKDDEASLNIIEQLGAKINRQKKVVNIDCNTASPIQSIIHCGESGLSSRMFTPIASLSSNSVQIVGSGSLLKRPFSFFENIFPALNVQIQSNKGLLPLKVQGPLIPNDILIDGYLSSQYITGFLMAFSAANASDKTIVVNNVTSKPYIDMTLDVMKKFGLKTPENNQYQEFYFSKNKVDANTNLVEYSIEADWSSASFIIVAAAIAGTIVLKSLNKNSYQADRMLLSVLESANIDFNFSNEDLVVNESKIQPFSFDATECPDLFPPLVVLASYAKGISKIKGVHRLLFKESNRAEALQKEFNKLGVEIKVEKDEMIIMGTGKIKEGLVHSHSDHRIAMACSIAALKAEGKIIVEESEAINKSYPNFFKHLINLGANVSLNK